MTIRFGINGACGRMGQRIVQLACQDKELQIGAALETAGHAHLGRDIGEDGIVAIAAAGVLCGPGRLPRPHGQQAFVPPLLHAQQSGSEARNGDARNVHEGRFAAGRCVPFPGGTAAQGASEAPFAGRRIELGDYTVPAP